MAPDELGRDCLTRSRSKEIRTQLDRFLPSQLSVAEVDQQAAQLWDLTDTELVEIQGSLKKLTE